MVSFYSARVVLSAADIQASMQQWDIRELLGTAHINFIHNNLTTKHSSSARVMILHV